MCKRNIFFLSVLSGVLLTPAWYSWGSGIFLFIAFIPLLMAEDIIRKSEKPGQKIFRYAFLSFFIWNLLSTWWIKNASFAGMTVAILLNSFLMTLPFWLFSLTRKKLGDFRGYFSLVLYWTGFEYLYLNGEISWTWLNLGNGMANNIRLIQWYEYTGTLGGTVWILLINILIYQLIVKYKALKSWNQIKTEMILTAIIILGPIMLSLYRFYTYREKSDPYEILVIQPNIDPYMKFNDIPAAEQMRMLIRIADTFVTPSTDYIVVPETFITDNLWLDQINEHTGIRMLKNFHSGFQQSSIVIGAVTYKIYKNPAEITGTAKPIDGFFYDSFNSALQIDSTDKIQVYHKSQLVVGVEKMPYPNTLRFLRSLTVRLGGTFRSHGIQDHRDTFVSPSGKCRVAPVICYESVFGEYVTEYISEAGANFIFVITNDGWWGDTPGYVQHNSFSRLRAIETRRSIARSANTGISAFINQKGEITKSLGWWKRGGILSHLNANDKLTFYVRHGDFPGRIALATGLIILMILGIQSIIIPIMERKKKRKGAKTQ